MSMYIAPSIHLKMVLIRQIISDYELSAILLKESCDKELISEWVIHLLDYIIYSVDHNDIEGIAILLDHIKFFQDVYREFPFIYDLIVDLTSSIE